MRNRPERFAVVALTFLLGCSNGTDAPGGAPGPAWPGTASAISAGSNNTCALTTSGKPYCWGSNQDHLLGVSGGYVGTAFVDNCQGGSVNSPIESRWPCLAGSPVALNGSVSLVSIVKIDDDATCGIDAAGMAWCWTIWPFVDLPSDTSSVVSGAYPLKCGAETCERHPLRVHAPLTFTSFAFGRYHGCGITTAGAAYCVGQNGSVGSLGIGTNLLSRSDTLRAVAGGHVFAQLAVSEGGTHTCALTAAGQAWCWGAGGAGQLGNGSAAASLSPSVVSGALSFTQITAGLQFTCGLRSTGQAYCWGNGNGGEFGNGTQSNAYAPTLAAGGKNFTAITAGGGHACGLDAVGSAWCWGADSLGQLGDAFAAPRCTVPGGITVPCSTTPVPVVGGVKFKALDAGLNHTCGISTTDEIWCWGDNTVGQLGTGYGSSRGPIGTPTKVSG